MQQNRKTRKIISVLISALMVLTMLPFAAITSVAATGRVYASGEWNYASSRVNSSRTAFDENGPFYISMAIADTQFVFMQTVDNQEFTYTTNFYCKKNNRPNEVYLDSVQTNVEMDRTFANMITSSSWALTGGQVDNPNPDGSPNAWGDGNRVGLKAEGFNGGKFTTYSYTCNFVANGSAVYHPTWQIEFTSRGAGIGYTQETHNTAYTVIQGESEAQNLNPVFTIQVIDMRELRTLVNMANDTGVDVTDITGGRDLSGNTYYTQEIIDQMVAALRVRLLCDYSALDAQLARAAEVDDNVNGALGGSLYDDDVFDAFELVYNQAKAIDRYLTDEDGGANQTLIDNTAIELRDAIDALAASRKALINYYSEGELFAQNTCVIGLDYNFHDVTDKFIGTPTKERYVFTEWVDENGNVVSGDTPITGDMDVYARFELRMEGIAPLHKEGKWEHKLSENDSDGRGDNYISMWVEATDFYFVQTQDQESFSFYTDLTAYKNDGGNTVRVNDVYLLPNDSDTQDFISAIGDHDIDVYCATKNSDEIPNNSGLPGALGSGYSYQSTIYRVVWRYIYTFNANGEATYRPKWNIEYTSGLWALSAGDHDLPDGGDPYVQFAVHVTDMRPLIEIIDKADSILNNTNNNFTEGQKAALRAVLDDINANYTLDGSVYYDQQTVNTQVERIKAYIPDDLVVACDYSVLDATIAAADAYDREHGNDNNHYIDEVWNNFLAAYEAATTVDRTLTVDEHNVNQPMIDKLARDLDFAIKELTYQTHVNVHADDSALQDLIDDVLVEPGTDNSNNKYDDDAWQDYIEALENAQDVIDQDLYIDSDGNNDNQQTIDDALQQLQDAIDNLNNPANQNDPCDYTALNDAIAAAESIGNSDLFTPATYQALQDALEAANAVPTDLYDDDAGNNQQTIDNAAAALNEAIANLLADAIDNADDVDTDGMTSGSADALADAVENAQAVADNSASSAGDKADAINDIVNAAESLTPDKTELEEAITAGESIDTTDLPQNLADALEDAITDGQTVDNDDDATVSEIKDATDAIKDAIDDILEYVIDEAENTDTTGMSDESKQDLQDAIDHANDVLNDPDATAQDKADAIEDIQNAVDGLTVDKSELEQKITEAQNEGNEPNVIHDEHWDNLWDVIDDAQAVLTDDDATVDEVQDAVQALEDAMSALTYDTRVSVTVDIYDAEGSYITSIEIKVEDGENISFRDDINPYLPDDVSSYLGANEIFLGWCDNNDELCDDSYYFDFDTQVAVYLKTQLSVITPNDSDGILVNRDTSVVYMHGLNADYSFAQSIKAGLENDETTIIITRADGVTELSDTDRAGTGCLVKCVNYYDHSIVYDTATIILYGDVDGNGEVDYDDYDAMFDEALFGVAIDGELFRIAGDVNNDGVIDGFDMSKVELQISGERLLDQSVEYYK